LEQIRGFRIPVLIEFLEESKYDIINIDGRWTLGQFISLSILLFGLDFL